MEILEEDKSLIKRRSPRASGLLLLRVFLYCFLGNIVSQLILSGFFLLWGDGKGSDLWNSMDLGDVFAQDPFLLLFSMGWTTLGTFIIPAWIIQHRFSEIDSFGEHSWKEWDLITWVLAFLIMLSFLPLNTWFIYWNRAISFPESWSSLEHWLEEREARVQGLIHLILGIRGNFLHYVGVFTVLAILPGIGEEILFRGILQPLFLSIFKQRDLSIWLVAIVFGLLHAQFYGLFPRICLGALFGYLFYFSGQLGLPIFLHIANNGLLILLHYLGVAEKIELSVEEPGLFSLVLGSILLIVFGYLFLVRQQKKFGLLRGFKVKIKSW
ncbi:MAG: CPBP family intramembrane metalloprotease [Cytophagales bacterium]|nr:CPBP family intramembrane metalloprotease [Cytophagales bacterium]